jgi:hypothetical protein
MIKLPCIETNEPMREGVDFVSTTQRSFQPPLAPVFSSWSRNEPSGQAIHSIDVLADVVLCLVKFDISAVCDTSRRMIVQFHRKIDMYSCFDDAGVDASCRRIHKSRKREHLSRVCECTPRQSSPSKEHREGEGTHQIGARKCGSQGIHYLDLFTARKMKSMRRAALNPCRADDVCNHQQTEFGEQIASPSGSRRCLRGEP